MEYKFKIGDYVETKEGITGYICVVTERGFRWLQSNSYNETWLGKNFDFKKSYNRIGEYDFTKEDNKIKKISLIANTVNDKVLCFEGMSNEDLLWKLTNKVNEIIDCLNKEEK